MPAADRQSDWQMLDDLFRAAIALDPGERDEYLDRECAHAPELRAEIESLLAHHNDTASPLDQPALGAGFKATIGIGAVPLPPPLDPGRVIGRYRIKRPIGRGGMSAVYEAEQEAPARPVALKVLHARHSERLVSRLRDEAAILASLHHEGVAQVYDVGIHDEAGADGAREQIAYIAMEHLPDAASLLDHARSRQLSRRSCAALMARVCDAVHHAHQRGVIHCDLKPSNILVDADGCLKVIDFGVARLRHESPADAGRRHELAGTPAYMSPEQFAPGNPADVRSDVYSLGMVLSELLGDPSPRPRPDDLDHVVRRALEHDPARRYQSALELGDDLRRCLERRPVLAHRATLAHRLSLAVRRNPLAAGASAALLLAVLTGIVLIGYWTTVAHRERRAAQRAVEFFDAMLASAHERRTGDEVRVTDLLAHAQEMLDKLDDCPPDVESQLRETIGRAYESLADYASALPEYKRALALAEESLGRDHPRTTRIRIELAGSLYDHGDFERAAEMLETMLSRGEPSDRAGGAVHAKIRNDLALAYLNLDRPADAERELLLSLEARERLLGRQDREYGQSLYNLGVAGVLQGKYNEAEPRLRAALEVYAPLGPEARGSIAATKRFIAICLAKRGEHAAAALLGDEAVADSLASQGERHPSYAAALAARAEVAREAGELDRAIELFGQAAGIYREKLGADHRRTRETIASAEAISRSFLDHSARPR